MDNPITPEEHARRAAQAVEARFDAMRARLAATFDGVPEEEARRLIDEACAQARRETAAEWRAKGRLP